MRDIVRDDLYVDFGIRKPHAVLRGRSRKVVFADRLESLGPVGCKIYLEAGCPRQALYHVMKHNTVCLVDGRLISSLREKAGLTKSDSSDVFLIRELARNDPGRFREMTQREQQEAEDYMAYAYYWKLAALIASLKNRQHAFLAEFGERLSQLDAILESLEREKVLAARCFDRFSNEVRRIGVRGVGQRLLGGILIRAHPSRFASMSAYLAYCGLKGSSRESGKYSRHVRSLYHQMSCCVIMAKDESFYPFYRKIKRDLETRFLSYPKWKIEGMARNRISTFLAKKVYGSLGSS